MQYLTTNLHTLRSSLMENIYKQMVIEIWGSTITILAGSVLAIATPEYYRQMFKVCLRCFFLIIQSQMKIFTIVFHYAFLCIDSSQFIEINQKLSTGICSLLVIIPIKYENQL